MKALTAEYVYFLQNEVSHSCHFFALTRQQGFPVRVEEWRDRKVQIALLLPNGQLETNGGVLPLLNTNGTE